MSMRSNLDLIRRVPLFSLLTNEQAQSIADSVVVMEKGEFNRWLTSQRQSAFEPVESRVVSYIRANPGCTFNAAVRGAAVNREEAQRVVLSLIAGGELEAMDISSHGSTRASVQTTA